MANPNNSGSGVLFAQIGLAFLLVFGLVVGCGSYTIVGSGQRGVES